MGWQTNCWKPETSLTRAWLNQSGRVIFDNIFNLGGKKEPENCCQCMNEAGLITILLCRNENVWNRNYLWFFILNLTFASIILHLQREKQARIQSLMHCQCWDFLGPYYSRACRVITREIFSTWTHISIQFQFRFQLQNITTQRAFSKVFLSYSDMAVSQT